jgi:hypothetical protein
MAKRTTLDPFDERHACCHRHRMLGKKNGQGLVENIFGEFVCQRCGKRWRVQGNDFFLVDPASETDARLF